MSITLSVEEAVQLVAAALERASTGKSQAASVAHALVAAEAAGHTGHGLRRAVAYCAQAKAKKVDGYAVPEAERSRPAVIRIDARHGFAFPALDLAVERLPAIAVEAGTATAAIRHSHHAGVLGLTVERFAEQGFVALMMVNTPSAMAPWGGSKGLFGTNPIAFAAPVPDEDPIVIDLSLSKVARGKVMAARQKGETIPQGWALDRGGQPTTDPTAALDGTMLPMGDAKGAALAMIVELLAAGLTGANYAYEASSLLDDKGPPPGLGQWLMVMDPRAMGGPGAISRIGMLAAEIARDSGARIPGRRGLNARRKAESDGFQIDETVIQAIRAV